MSERGGTPARSAPRWPLVGLAALLLAHAAQITWVVRTDRSLPFLAIADHQVRSAHIAHALGEAWGGGWALGHEVLVGHCGYRPPLPILAPVPLIAWWPDDPGVAGLAGVLWTALLLSGAYRLGARWADRPTGLAAATVLGGFPSVLGHRAVVLPFLPEAACLAQAGAALAAHRDGRSSVEFGIWAGLALLVRWDALVWLAALGVGHLASTPDRRAALRRLLPGLVAAAAVCGPWYVALAPTVLSFYLGEGLLSLNHPHEDIYLLSHENLGFHPWRLFSCHAGYSLGALYVLAMARLCWLRHPASTLLVAWVGLSWLFYLVVPMKSARYMMPALPAVACAIALGARSLHAPALALIAAASIALAQQVALVHWPAAERRFTAGVTDPLTWGGRPDLAEAALDHGRLTPWTDPSWRDCLDRIAAALRARVDGPTEVQLADDGLAEYLSALELYPGLNLHPPAAIPADAVEERLSQRPFLVLALPSRPRDPLRARIRSVAYRESLHRPLLLDIALPGDRQRVRIYGPR